MINIEELLSLLDMKDPSDFEYFEQLADLMELDEEISFEDFYKVLGHITFPDLSELVDNYFEDILVGVPDNSMDIHVLMGNIQNLLISLTTGKETPEKRRTIIEELYRFRNWYAVESLVTCVEQGGNNQIQCTISEALTLYRLEKLGDTCYDYDFSNCENYS
ncbi:MAG: hypothetical protein ACOX4U_07605 [Anaerovoracaceae bacterium]